ncbi:PREDICTED: uncharacterized protein LOC107342677 [Acropora digitifera]|uniref:uncharacterized protein LOC107342677 n=1 Tax=Acropora digitifera TaxID=70779 RepID=UPI00077A13CA|nr:PREDICTED: uncharacterized protein LOC107342677 [Acropora digitifera]
MAQQSQECYLGLEFLNPNKSVDMVNLLKTFHDKYVPVAEYQDGSKEVIHKIPLDGDQLTEERARNVQWSARMGATSYDHLEGLETNHADWHWKVKLLQIAEELFVKGESSGEIGTSVASMNRTGKFSAKKGPYNEYNAFKEFFDRETDAHIIATWLSFAGIQKMLDCPLERKVPDSLKSWSKNDKRKWLHDEISVFLDRFLFDNNGNTITEVHVGIARLEQGRTSGFKCRFAGCNDIFMLHPQRVKENLAL